jgi:UDP-N-acetylmuramate--alanine ligase
MFFKKQHLHFVGIGGIGMSSIAEVLLNLGYTISGSDQRLSAITARLATLGARIFEGHAASNVGDAKAVVVTSAVATTCVPDSAGKASRSCRNLSQKAAFC